jgi:Na+/melibiose symporter-like transporter
MQNKTNKLSAKTKVGFALGDVFGGGSFNIINFMYPAYAALTLGLGASLAGIIVLISKIWDAITQSRDMSGMFTSIRLKRAHKNNLRR